LINEGVCLPISLRPSREDLKNGWEKPTLSEEEKSDHENNVIMNDVAAVSVGLIGDDIYLDLDYILDSNADVDMNVVMTSNGEFVEVQGTGVKHKYSREQLNSLLNMAEKGNSLLHEMQVKVLSDAN
jgi:ribonuclease PH